MGWFWGSTDSNDDEKSKDPLRDLDPSLRDFLKKESPVKYDSSNPPLKSTESSAEAPKHFPSTAAVKPLPTEGDSSPVIPEQSLYKDGRYAHLWKTYQSQADVENANKSDQEKIVDVLEGYKTRKAEIGKAALENCALEQWEVNDCFKNGSWGSRLTMCRDENRKLERCHMMQSRFLKALGYLSTMDRAPEVDEQIQMHADTLYHRMLKQEEEIELAKKENRPIPTFPPILSSRPKFLNPAESLDNNKIQPTELSAKVQKGFKERLKKLNPEERDLEERAIKAEIQAGEQVAGHLESIYKKQEEERRLRKEQGKETVSDRVRSLFGTK